MRAVRRDLRCDARGGEVAADLVMSDAEHTSGGLAILGRPERLKRVEEFVRDRNPAPTGGRLRPRSRDPELPLRLHASLIRKPQHSSSRNASRERILACSFAVEREYGLAAKHYGRTVEIDHIVSLELGGSNDIANLYPEEATFRNHAPGYHTKDRLENRLHDLVCAGSLRLRTVQRQIAANWQALYKRVFGVRRIAVV
jgi:hypothetical protein